MNQFSRNDFTFFQEQRPESFIALARRVKPGPPAAIVARLANPEAANAIGLCSLRRAIEDFSSRSAGLDGKERKTLLQLGQMHWSDTTLAHHQRVHARAFLAEFIGRLEPMQRPIELIDFGAGDGRMTIAALDGLAEGGARISSVELIDQNIPALTEARARFTEGSNRPPVIATPGDFRTQIPSGSGTGTTLALASAAFHELDAEHRVRMFSRLSHVINGLFVVELSRDNDHVNLTCGQGVLKVAKFYDRLIGDAYTSLEPSKLWPVIGVFLLGEFLQIISSDYANRGNYHLPLTGWTASLAASGFHIEATYKSSLGELTTGYVLAASRRLR